MVWLMVPARCERWTLLTNSTLRGYQLGTISGGIKSFKIRLFGRRVSFSKNITGHAYKTPVPAIHLETCHPCFWEANAGSMRDLFGWNDAQWQQIYLPIMSSWLCWNYGSLCHMPRGCQWGKWDVPMFTKSGGFTSLLPRTRTGNHYTVVVS